MIQEFLRPIHRGLQNAYSECFTQALQVRKRRVLDRVVMTRGERNVGTFVSHEKKHVRKSLNTLNVLNAKFDSLCAGRWLISYLFVTTNSQIAAPSCGN